MKVVLLLTMNSPSYIIAVILDSDKHNFRDIASQQAYSLQIQNFLQ